MAPRCKWCRSPITQLYPIGKRPLQFCSYACSKLSRRFTRLKLDSPGGTVKLHAGQAERFRKLRNRQIGSSFDTLVADFIKANPELPVFRPEDREDSYSVATARLFRSVEQRWSCRRWDDGRDSPEEIVHEFGRIDIAPSEETDFPLAHALKITESRP